MCFVRVTGLHKKTIASLNRTNSTSMCWKCNWISVRELAPTTWASERHRKYPSVSLHEFRLQQMYWYSRSSSTEQSVWQLVIFFRVCCKEHKSFTFFLEMFTQHVRSSCSFLCKTTEDDDGGKMSHRITFLVFFFSFQGLLLMRWHFIGKTLNWRNLENLVAVCWYITSTKMNQHTQFFESWKTQKTKSCMCNEVLVPGIKWNLMTCGSYRRDSKSIQLVLIKHPS